jgi:hypothetical protein
MLKAVAINYIYNKIITNMHVINKRDQIIKK